MGKITTQDVSERLKRSLGHYTDLTNIPSQLRQICDRGYTFGSLGVSWSDGIETQASYRFKYTVRNDCYDVKPVFANYMVSGGDIPNTTPITINATLEYNNTMIPLRFNGNSSISLDGESFAIADSLGIDLKAGEIFYIRVHVVVISGNKYPQNLWVTPSTGDGKATGVDYTTTGTLSTVNVWGYGPVAIVGHTKSTSKSIIVIGDSIAAGVSDNGINTGFIPRAIRDKYNYGLVARSGETAGGFQGLTRRLRNRQISNYYTHSIVEYGINDIASSHSLSTIQADLTSIWNSMVSRGMKVFQTTITPQTTSTDSWSTTTNQTPFAQETVRKQLNDWIRTIPSPLSGYFEVADLAETYRNSGIWKAGFSSDGVHPNGVGHAALVSGIDISKLN
jgi:lysophospholipase L1-like esterase